MTNENRLSIELREGWKLRHERMTTKIEEAAWVLGKTDGWMQAAVPCDIHEVLMAHGMIGDPALGLNCFDGEWTEKKSWWYTCVFDLDESLLSYPIIELSAEVLDIYADILVNGNHIGRHESAFYEFRKDVKRYLHAGKNELVIRLTAGLEYFSEDDLMTGETPIQVNRKRDDSRRRMLRKPQYSFGWDWCPRAVSCGILSPVVLTGVTECVIRSAYVSTDSISPVIRATCHVDIENTYALFTREATVHMQILDGETVIAEAEETRIFTSGENYVEHTFALSDAKLWWPNGAGEHPLYTVRVWLESPEGIDRYPDFLAGFRTFTVSQDKLHDDHHEFTFTVNGVKIFSKGANFVPMDLFQTRITDEGYRVLVEEAVNANFNTLRVWGGGLYERHAFYDYCDEMGILVWQDFAFACAFYPETADMERKIENEMTFQIRRLRRHTSLAIMCGNNEMHWGYAGNPPESLPYQFLGALYYNHTAPKLIHMWAPHIFYWNSSPYGGHDRVGDGKIGDAHIWFEVPWNREEEKYITPEAYDTCVTSKFVSEYGFLGACCRETIETYMQTDDIDQSGKMWYHHTNNQNLDNGSLGWISDAIKKHYRSPENLSLDDFILYSSLTQGLFYEYSLSAFRARLDCYGVIFWMYNDCWGEIGWTIMDYYLRRKISYNFVRRAFAPVMLVARHRGDTIIVTGINDTPRDVDFSADYGYFQFDGSSRETNQAHIHLPAFSRQEVLEFSWNPNDATKGSFFVLPDAQSGIRAVILRQTEFRYLKTVDPKLELRILSENGSQIKFSVMATAYAHAVHFNFPCDARLSDEYFDLLPGETRIVTALIPETAEFSASGITATSVRNDITPDSVDSEGK